MNRKNLNRLLVASLCFGAIGTASAVPSQLTVQPMPVMEHGGSKVMGRLDGVRRGILRDEKECEVDARNSGATASYRSDIKKLSDTSRFVSIEVRSISQCGGAHPDGYQYGMTFDTRSGARVNVNKVHSLADRKDGRLFLTADGAALVREKYLAINATTPGCSDPKEFSPDFFRTHAYSGALDDAGALHVYLAVPYAEFACVGSIVLQPGDLKPFANESELAKLGLQ